MAKHRICGITCPLCKDFVFSRTRHDMRSCSCGGISIDGGRDYIKITWDAMKVPIPSISCKYITQSDAVLARDWNFRIDKYGIIKKSKKSGRSSRVHQNR